MRISDWSSDVFSSDLVHAAPAQAHLRSVGHSRSPRRARLPRWRAPAPTGSPSATIFPNPMVPIRSEEHTSELQSLMRISYAVFCLKKKKSHTIKNQNHRIKYIPIRITELQKNTIEQQHITDIPMQIQQSKPEL